MNKTLKVSLNLILVSLIPTLLVWIPFFLQLEGIWGIPIPQNGMQTVISNYDGPLYIVVAKSFYNLDFIAQNYSFPLPLEYYAAHFPLYPLMIRGVSYITGYPWAMLLSTVLGTLLSSIYFYKLARLKLNEKESLWLTIIFSFFPARWLIVKSVGSPEPFFVGSILAAIYYFRQEKFWRAGLFGALAQLTKSPGLLLFFALSGSVAFEKLKDLASTKQSIRKWFSSLNFKAYPILLIPISLIALFNFYGLKATFNDFLAYFHSGENIHLFFPPFQIFNYSQPWVAIHWLEEIIFVYLLIAFAFLKLIKEKMRTEAWFVGIFFLSIIFVSHRDIVRYALPIVSLLILAFGKELQKRESKIVFIFLIIPIYLFTLAFISNNAMPIGNWEPFL